MTSAADAHPVAALEPAAVWRFFADIAAVPRPSKHEQRIRAHVRQTAERLGLAVREDAAGNLVVAVPASPGHGDAPVTVLQGHLDMVCEKNAGTPHDFERDPIRLVLDRDPQTGREFVRADGTTLGADNGIGIALALAAASSPDVVHGPLEILCTVDEEMGMSGAGALEPGFFSGRRFLNLDSEEDDVLYIGCAGGGDVTLTREFALRPLDERAELARVTVSGLRGGHSGGDIHENRANAIKVLARVLTAPRRAPLRIAGLSGGSKRNAIAREASALVAGSHRTIGQLRRAAEEVRAAVVRESAETHAAIRIEPAERSAAGAALSPADSARLLLLLTGLPHGVLETHPQVRDLVQTSNNLATIAAEPVDGHARLRVTVGNLSRSSIESRLEATRAQVAAVGRLAGAAVELGHSYPGWEPNIDSPLLATCRRIYRELFGADPKVTAIHAGLECGIIGRRVPGLDMVSLGPQIKGAHSPDERVYVDSVRKSYRFLTAILAELARG